MRTRIDYYDDEEYGVKQSAANKTMKCPECGRTCTTDQDYCEDCGAFLDTESSEDEVNDEYDVEEYDEESDSLVSTEDMDEDERDEYDYENPDEYPEDEEDY